MTQAPPDQSLYLGLDLVPRFARGYHWGKLGKGYMGSVTTTACQSTIIFKSLIKKS